MPANPLARQRRLGAAILNLREARGWSHAELGRRSGVSASTISRLENPFGDIARRPNLAHVRRLLDALEVPRRSSEREQIEEHAEVASARRWSDAEPYAAMGAGQRMYALVELGAGAVDEYAPSLLPGLVQTEAYARHRVLAGEPRTGRPDAIVAGRLARQRQVVEQGTTYRLVLEEVAVRRYPVPRPVMADQLRHLLDLAEQPAVSIRVVPVEADLGDGPAPRAPYAHISYPDPADPPVVIVDAVGSPLLDTADVEIAGYARLYARLQAAALSDADSAELIRQVAKGLAASI